MEQAVYRLESFRFLRKYEGFERSNPRNFPDFYPEEWSTKKWKAPRLAKFWVPQKFIGDVWSENDFPCEGAPAWVTPVFSQRAVEGLREFLEPNGELLPVFTPMGTYYAYNVTTVVDALDVQKTQAGWWVKKARAHEI